jgi:predicted AAA+ superfamily ATPase
MINREASIRLKELMDRFKAVAVIGPRQSGKTTLIRKIFHRKPYVSLENPDSRNFALEDPRGFLSMYPGGVILDEIQRAPLLFSYLQEILDQTKEKGMFILSGSNNFLLQENISQSLAGRVGYLQLLPFSIKELDQQSWLPNSDEALMLKGFYPPVYDQEIPASDWYPNYISTYIEKDVRQIKNISNLIVFERFLRLLAGRNAQELNLSALSVETGVDVKTVQAWISILESSFIIYLLRPHHKNFNKTIVKRPKLYFYDTAIVCNLLGIQTEDQLTLHPLRGAIFEGMVLTELIKIRTNAGQPHNLFYWRDKTGHEIDIVSDEAGKLTPIEIKAGKTIQQEYFKNIDYWNTLSGNTEGYVLYTGDQQQKRSSGITVSNWRNVIRKKLI